MYEKGLFFAQIMLVIKNISMKKSQNICEFRHNRSRREHFNLEAIEVQNISSKNNLWIEIPAFVKPLTRTIF